MRKIQYWWDGKLFTTDIPNGWPIDAVVEVCAFRAGAKPGKKFSFDITGEGMLIISSVEGNSMGCHSCKDHCANYDKKYRKCIISHDKDNHTYAFCLYPLSQQHLCQDFE